MQAIILAAGMGRRLKELTDDNPKCMVKVSGITLIERMLTGLDKLSLERIVVVIGYKGEKLKNTISQLPLSTKIEYIENEIYNKTNNIYSLYLAKDYLLQSDTLLLESDLIFDDKMLTAILEHEYPSLALVARYESWMDGAVVTLAEDNMIKSFLSKKDFVYEDISGYYKTVNIYKFSKNFSRSHYVPFLEAYIKALGENEYYEQVLKVITLLDKPEIKALPIEGISWYEIDDIQDLDIAESIFATSPAQKLEKMSARYGGYWRYPNILDYCYLVNPYYPPAKLMEEIKANFAVLLQTYPSGQQVNSLISAKYFSLSEQQVVVGNGAAELIKALLEGFAGKVGTVLPTFEEYPNRAESLVVMSPKNNNFSYSASDIIEFFDDKDISMFVLINPDNPSGNYLNKSDVEKLLAWSKQKSIMLVVDESFIDFAENCQSILTKEVLNRNPQLVVIKSISKSFGVPGIRLGILASGDEKLIKTLKKRVSIWNINSFGEFYMQIAEKYKDDYAFAIEQFKQSRRIFLTSLRQIEGLRVIPTQANYVMCEITKDIYSKKLAEVLLSDYNVLIKDLSAKKGIDGQYIRLAIKTQSENNFLISALKKIFEVR